jgi:ATP-dependent phosphoenolpyruvate carboxykinase
LNILFEIKESYLLFLIYFSVSTLYEYAMQPEHRQSVGDVTVYPTTITDTGALSVASGVKTGRVPKEKRIVYDDTTKNVSLIYHFLTIFQK